MKKAALFFGSFNPLHKGHLAILSYLLEKKKAERVLLVVSPQNPLKDRSEIPPIERLERIKHSIALTGMDIEVSDAEFHLKPPYYTIRTLLLFKKREPDWEHIMVMGADNLANLERWKDYKKIIEGFQIWVYPRKGFNVRKLCKRYRESYPKSKIKYLNAPLIDISSTEIREGLAKGIDMSMWKV